MRGRKSINLSLVNHCSGNCFRVSASNSDAAGEENLNFCPDGGSGEFFDLKRSRELTDGPLSTNHHVLTLQLACRCNLPKSTFHLVLLHRKWVWSSAFSLSSDPAPDELRFIVAALQSTNSFRLLPLGAQAVLRRDRSAIENRQKGACALYRDS